MKANYFVKKQKREIIYIYIHSTYIYTQYTYIYIYIQRVFRIQILQSMERVKHSMKKISVKIFLKYLQPAIFESWYKKFPLEEMIILKVWSSRFWFTDDTLPREALLLLFYLLKTLITAMKKSIYSCFFYRKLYNPKFYFLWMLKQLIFHIMKYMKIYSSALKD